MHPPEPRPHLGLALQRCVQEHPDRRQAGTRLNRLPGFARVGVAVRVHVQVMAVLAHAAGPVPAQRLLIITGPGIDLGRAEPRGPRARGIEQPCPDALALLVRVHRDRVDRGQAALNRQVQHPGNRTRLHRDQLRASRRGPLGRHHIIEVRRPQERQHTAAQPLLLIGRIVITDHH